MTGQRQRATGVFGAAALALLCACGPTEPAATCNEPAQQTTRCCNPDIYAPATVTQLASGEMLNREVEVRGIADWDNATRDCACAGEVCGCVISLALRSSACGTAIRLGGSYSGREVACTDAGCYPLSPLSSYAVCGKWVWQPQLDSPGQGVLELHAFCED